MRKKLESGADIEEKDYEGKTAILAATESGNVLLNEKLWHI